jgi:hypothetical protein
MKAGAASGKSSNGDKAFVSSIHLAQDVNNSNKADSFGVRASRGANMIGLNLLEVDRGRVTKLNRFNRGEAKDLNNLCCRFIQSLN